MGRRKRLLVPEARDAMEKLKMQVIQDQSQDTQGSAPSSPDVPQMASALGIPYREQGNGDMKTRDAGKLGGNIGGPMVKRLIALAEESLREPPSAPTERQS